MGKWAVKHYFSYTSLGSLSVYHISLNIKIAWYHKKPPSLFLFTIKRQGGGMSSLINIGKCGPRTDNFVWSSFNNIISVWLVHNSKLFRNLTSLRMSSLLVSLESTTAAEGKVLEYPEITRQKFLCSVQEAISGSKLNVFQGFKYISFKK